MKNKRIFSFVFAAVIMMVLASGVSAQSFAPYQEQINAPASANQPGSILSVAAEVSEAIRYQGVLEENGIPITGSRDMTFSLYSDDGCTTSVNGIVDISDVPIDNGHFSVQLDFDPSVFTGQALFLEVQVESTAIACQEILAVPYALKPRPTLLPMMLPPLPEKCHPRHQVVIQSVCEALIMGQVILESGSMARRLAMVGVCMVMLMAMA